MMCAYASIQRSGADPHLLYELAGIIRIALLELSNFFLQRPRLPLETPNDRLDGRVQGMHSMVVHVRGPAPSYTLPAARVRGGSRGRRRSSGGGSRLAPWGGFESLRRIWGKGGRGAVRAEGRVEEDEI